MPEKKSCGFIVFRREPVMSFLLMKHPTRYDLPKGHVDPGETEIACALRELQEETGLLPDQVRRDDQFRFTMEYPVRDRRSGRIVPKTLVVFLAWLVRDVPLRLTEHQSYVWMPWNPPHRIQKNTIDPLLAELERYLGERSDS